MLNRNFNTTKVRLFRVCEIRWHHNFQDFNTTKVRLFPAAGTRQLRNGKLFQYHKGAIISRRVKVVLPNALRFQYHKGAIISWMRRSRLRTTRHISIPQRCDYFFATNRAKSPLRRNFNTTKVRLFLDGFSRAVKDVCKFQYHKGAIISAFAPLGAKIVIEISIPQRCDYFR